MLILRYWYRKTIRRFWFIALEETVGAFFLFALKVRLSWATKVLRSWNTKRNWCFIVSEGLQYDLAKANHLSRCICGDVLWPGEQHPDCVGDDVYPADWDEEDEYLEDEGRIIPVSDSPGGFVVCQ